VTIDVLLGRTLACCAHPYAAWRGMSASGRFVLIAAYAGASYVAVLALLLIV
jgi:hypothetical protein